MTKRRRAIQALPGGAGRTATQRGSDASRLPATCRLTAGQPPWHRAWCAHSRTAVSNLIREGKTFQIPSLMQTQRQLGMRTLNDSLFELVKGKLVEPKEAFIKAVDKAALLALFERGGIRFDPDKM